MPSLIPGWEYDIFISYRHNDNRSGWVTDFVRSLREELAATIKEPISIYFDTNPHDGLLETYHVDKSLEGKLKCLIFIPVISQTYCDPKSFAWQYEFCAFNKQAQEDHLGREIRLNNGNVASRILPVKIHDLDAEDKATIENELGGALRAIEFIFNTPGVSRPLTPSDRREENLNKIFYPDQVNKAARAIKDLIVSIQRSGDLAKAIPAEKNAAVSPKKKFGLTGAAVLLCGILIFAYYYFAGFGNKVGLTFEKSIAVLPFENMSNDPDQEYVGDGVAEEIINVLAQSNDLKVIARSSSFMYKGKNEDLRKIGEQLGVAHVLEGSVRKSGDSLRITAKLIKTNDGGHLWSKVFKKKSADIFAVQDEIAQAVAEAFKVTISDKRSSAVKPERNEEAYKLYLQGRFFYERAGRNDFRSAAEYFKKSVQSDSSRAIVWTFLANCHFFLGNTDEANRYLQKSYELDPKLSETLIIMAERALGNLDVPKVRDLFSQVVQLKSPSPMVIRSSSFFYHLFGEEGESLVAARRAVELDPLQPFSLDYLGQALMREKKYKEAELAYRKILEISNDFMYGRLRLVLALLMEQDYEAAMVEAKKMNDEDDQKVVLCAITYKMGNKSDSDKMLKELMNKYGAIGDFFPFCALIHALRNEPDEALQYLEQAYEARASALIGIMSDSFFTDLRTSPRYIALQKKLKLID